MSQTSAVEIAVQTLVDKKAEDIKVLDLSKLSSFTDFFIIATVLSERHLKALADQIEDALRPTGVRPLFREGLSMSPSASGWAILDYGDMVIHLFLEQTRELYNLEGFWEAAPRVELPPSIFAPAASQVRAAHPRA